MYIEYARNKSLKHTSELLSNDVTLKQLLARSRYLPYKDPSNWMDRMQMPEKQDLFH